MSDLSDGIRRVRRLRLMSEADCARAAGVSATTWRRVEKGQLRPDDDLLRRAFGLTCEEVERVGADDPALREGL